MNSFLNQTALSLMIQCQGRTASGYPQCNLNDFFNLMNHLSDIVFSVMTVVVGVVIMVGGLMMIFSDGQPAKFALGKAVLFNAIIGMIIIFSAYAVVSTILKVLNGNF